MKVYNYKCPTCEKVEEHFVKDTDTVVKCDGCSVKMERQVCVPGMVRTDTGGRQVT